MMPSANKNRFCSVPVPSLALPLPVLSCLALPLLALPLLGASLWAQTAHQSGGQPGAAAVPTLHVDARTVVVDVVATDANDQPVTDLTQKDFQVSENGKPQKIAYFEPHMGPAAVAVDSQKLPPGIFSNTPTVAPAGAVNLLLLDGLNTQMRDQVYVRKAMESYLATAAPGASMAMFSLGARLRLVQGFTSDMAALRTAIASPVALPTLSPLKNTEAENTVDQARVAQIGQYAQQNADPAAAAAAQFAAQSLEDTNSFKLDERVNMTCEALQQIARYLGGIPGRKNLIWFSGAFPFAIFQNPADLLQGANVRQYKDKLDRTAALLTAAQVAIYPIDPKGANGSLLVTQQATMDELAEQTGGEAFYNRNDLGSGVARAVSNGSHYYTLAYTPENGKLDGTFRNIKVVVDGKKINLNYRKGYYATRTTQPPGDPLRPMMDAGMPQFSQVLYKELVQPASPQPAATAPRAGDNPAVSGPVTRETVLFRIDGKDVTYTPAPDGSRMASLEVAIVAYDTNGKPVNWLNRTVEVPQSAVAAQQAVAFPLQIDVPANATTLRTGLYEAAGSKAGTLEIPVSAISPGPIASK